MTEKIGVEMFSMPLDAEVEVERILGFLNGEIGEYPAVVAVSGGLDSDVVARLTVRAIGAPRTKLFVVLQDDMDPRHLMNAETMAGEVDVPLVRIDLRGMPVRLIEAMAAGDPAEQFSPTGILDPARAKCSVRTPILSTYQDRGYVVVGTSNRTELETGFFLPFGDGLAHVQPIIHLYKMQVRCLAMSLGVRQEVLDQPASSGFWLGAEDLWDIAYWLFAGEPIRRDRSYTEEDLSEVTRIHSELATERVDHALMGIATGLADPAVSSVSGLTEPLVARLRKLVQVAQPRKQRPFFRRLEPVL
jgi:NAD+ synthase